MKALVTGGAGFIGSHVADSLIAMGYEVIVLDDLSGGCVENIPEKACFIKGSVTDSAVVNKVFREHRIDYVFHLAAYAAEGLSHFIRCYNYQTNLIGSCILINEAVNAGTVKCFVFTSSIAVYGAGQTPMTEGMTPQPEDPYGISKYAVELDLEAARRMFGLNYVIFRPHNVYGERQNIADPYRNVIGIFMRQALAGEAMTLFGDGTQTRAFTHIDDVAPAIAASAARQEVYDQVFNIGADKPYSVNELADCVAKVLGVECRKQYLPARNEVLHAFSEHSKVRGHFGDCMRDVSLHAGLSRMAAWVRSAKKHPVQRFSGIEIWKNMPPKWALLAESCDEKKD
jgi:UDP-glucose 4-epimerase